MNSIVRNLFAQQGLPSLESLVAEGETVIEREYEIYGTLSEEELKSVLSHQDFEHQEQWGVPMGDLGTVRVRRTETPSGVVYTMTIKVKTAEGNRENELEVTQETYELFRSMVEKGLSKTRFIHPVEGTDLKLEIDVFKDPDGEYINTVKIDLEVPEGTDIANVRIPYQIQDVRVIKPGKKSDSDLEYVKKLFQSRYEIKNPHYGK